MNAKPHAHHAHRSEFRWVSKPPSLYGVIADPRSRQFVPPWPAASPLPAEEERVAGAAAGETGSSPRRLLVALLAVLVAAGAYATLGSEGNDGASALQGGVEPDAVVASLAAERREHLSLALLRPAPEPAESRSPTGATAQPQSSQAKAGSPAEPGQETKQPPPPQQTGGEQSGEGGSEPGSGNLTLPVLGETPLPEPELPLPNVGETELPSLDPTGLTEADPETLLP